MSPSLIGGFVRRRVAKVAVAATLAFAVLAAFWPGMAVVGAAVALVLLLAYVHPGYAFILSLFLFGAEGSVKILISETGSPLSFSGRAVGAALIDIAFLGSAIALVVATRAELHALWTRIGRVGRLAAVGLGAWIAVSAAQIAQGSDLERGAAGFRLTQVYVLAAVAGAALAARGERRWLGFMLGGLALIAVYGGIRAIVGPRDAERDYALAREGVTEFESGEIFRAVGSFSGGVGLVSYLVPLAVFAFGVAFVAGRYRALALSAVSFAIAGLVGSYVRAGVVALAIGLVATVGLSLTGAALSRRRKGVIAAAALTAIVAAGIATAVAAEESPETRARAGGLVRPSADESFAQRRAVWRRALADIRDEPLGTGLGTVGSASGLGDTETVTTDNSYLKIAREQGIPVALLFLLALGGACFVVVRGVLRAPPGRRGLATAAFAAFLSFLALALVGEYVEQPGKVLAWTLLGVAAWEACREPEPA